MVEPCGGTAAPLTHERLRRRATAGSCIWVIASASLDSELGAADPVPTFHSRTRLRAGPALASGRRMVV